MDHQSTKQCCEIGIVGLGVMGSNLLLNIADHGFSVAGYDTHVDKVIPLNEAKKERGIYVTADIKEFIKLLRAPRAVLLMVPAGAAVDAAIHNLLPFLQAGDLIIDAGNSYFKDTDIRASHLAAKGIHFMGMGVSGGEEGARHGPSMMPGGSKDVYERVRFILEAIAAKVHDEPCVTYLGAGSVGHFVKMVHNGIEYGMMQLIAETYDLMKSVLHLNNQQLSEIYHTWNKGKLNGYLLEITCDIFAKHDEKTGASLIDQIVAIAAQNGTGMWTSRSGMELQIPTPTIDIAVALRDLSVLMKQREQAGEIYQKLPKQHDIDVNQTVFLKQLESALYVGFIITYAQGMALLTAASKQYNYHLELENVARIWRGGCIIRSALLEEICIAFGAKKDLPNLLLASNISEILIENQQDLRSVVMRAIQNGIPVSGLVSALSYFDIYRRVQLPANLIQAQRDYFGAHTYQRIDMSGQFHTEWK